MAEQATPGFEVRVNFDPIIAELGAEVGNLRAQLAVKEGIIRSQHGIIEEQRAMITMLTKEPETPPEAPEKAPANGRAKAAKGT